MQPFNDSVCLRIVFRWGLLILFAILPESVDAATTRLGTDTEAPPQRLALLIGNSNYEHLDQLKNPKNDVSQLAAKLQKLGFDASIEYDLNHDGFVDALSTFENKIAPGDIVLFYYSGHGIQVGG